MSIYILNIFFSVILIFLSLLFKNRGNKILYYIFLSMGLVIPCVLAGVRSIDVGFDTHFYVYGLFERTKYFSNPIDYIKAMDIFWQINDVSYLLITFISAKLFNNFNVLLFIIEILVIFPVYKSITNYTDNKNSIIISMIIFYLFWYNASFNMVRQSIALSFSLLSMSYIHKSNCKKSLIYNIIAFTFHETAVFTLFLNLIYYLFKSKKISEDTKIKILNFFVFISFIIVASLLVVVAILNSDIPFFENISNNIHYFIYLKQANFDFSYIDTFLYLYIFLILILCKNKLIESGIDYRYFKSLSLSSIIILQIGTIIPYGERLSFYLIYPLIIDIFPIAIHSCNTKKLFFIQKFSILIFIVYWIVIFKILGVHNTIPYQFYF